MALAASAANPFPRRREKRSLRSRLTSIFRAGLTFSVVRRTLAQMDAADRSDLPTERRLPESMHLDAMGAAQIVAVMNAQDRVAVDAVAAVAADVARAVEIAVKKLSQGGRLIYVGAGTSGRLGVLDAAECPPTFRTDPATVLGIIAGGQGAMFRSAEGAEDSAEQGAAAVDGATVGPADFVVGIAAGGTTPFVHGTLRRARHLGAATGFIACVPPTPGEPAVDVQIRPITGPEVLTGSTRLKAGTATKLVLNQISTATMVRLGKCYENLMVDLNASNAKLRDRAGRIVGALTGLPIAEATELLAAAGGVKAAVVMHRRGVGVDEAGRLLDRAGGRLREVI